MEHPLMPDAESLFTFGLEHPLRSHFVRIRLDPEAARSAMVAYFGTNWSSQYPGEEEHVLRRSGLKEVTHCLPGLTCPA
jgi:hypothetical protein